MIFPGGVFAVPQEITIDVGPLARNADLVTVEVAGLLSTFAVCVDVVLIGETAQFFAVASVNGGQIAAAVIVVAIWQRSSESCWLSDDLYVNC